MRKLSLLGIGGLLLTSLAGSPAKAALLPISGTLDVFIKFPQLNIPTFTHTLASSGAAVAQVNGTGPPGHLSSASLAGGIFSTVGFIHVPTTNGAVKGIKVTAVNGAGAFTPMGGLASGFGGVMPIIGAAQICLLQSCNSTSPLPLLLTLPLNVVGAGGATTVINGGFTFMAQGSRWTTGVISANTAKAIFQVTGSRMSSMGGMSATANASGTLTLVTPFLITSSLGPAFNGYGYARMQVHFTPEPHSGLLVLAAAALLWFAMRQPARGERSAAEGDRSGA